VPGERRALRPGLLVAGARENAVTDLPDHPIARP
jgi:hypothetical protein